MSSAKFIVIGSGPAGMGCAYTLAKAKQPCAVIEKEKTVGGLCRTLNFHSYRFDIGGHRFISKSDEANKLWLEVMGDDMLRVRRLSRIYYRKKFFKYPLSFFNTLWNLGLLESFLCISSYLYCRIFKPGSDDSFAGWIINRFGRRLYGIFFKTYTEKVWAVACQDISADWAIQRIRGLSLRVAIQKAIFGTNSNNPKTLYDNFLYPRTGPGDFYERLKGLISVCAGEFIFERELVSVKHNAGQICSIAINDLHSKKIEELPVDYLFSSIPLPRLIEALNPSAPEDIIACARNLRFRSFLVVNIILNKKHIFPDQWIYVHSPEVKLGRIQNYKNWSPAMVADYGKTSLGLEYFCTKDDDLWMKDDVDLINYAVEELERIGIVSRRYLIDGFVVRRPDAYPVYSLGYQRNVEVIKEYLTQFSNLQSIGRAGLFRYDNSDHALLTGIYAARNLLAKAGYDIWKINADEKYLES